jgi:hypothetical protein
MWLRAGSRLFESLDGGASATDLSAEHGVALDHTDLSHVKSFVAGMMSVAEAVRPPEPVAPEVQQISEQVCSLLLRLREVSQKIPPVNLYARFPAKLRHNLDIALADAHRFVTGLHSAWNEQGEAQP